MRSYWNVVGPWISVTGVFIKRINLDIGMNVGKMLYEHKDRDKSECIFNPKNPKDCQKLGEGHGRESLFQLTKEAKPPCLHFDLRCGASRTVKQHFLLC